jgi:hypothetical protein
MTRRDFVSSALARVWPRFFTCALDNSMQRQQQQEIDGGRCDGEK